MKYGTDCSTNARTRTNRTHCHHFVFFKVISCNSSLCNVPFLLLLLLHTSWWSWFFFTPNTKHLTSSLKHTSFKIPLHLFNSDGPAVRLFTSMLKMKHDLVSFGNPILAYCFFYDNSVLEIIPPHFWWEKMFHRRSDTKFRWYFTVDRNVRWSYRDLCKAKSKLLSKQILCQQHSP